MFKSKASRDLLFTSGLWLLLEFGLGLVGAVFLMPSENPLVVAGGSPAFMPLIALLIRCGPTRCSMQPSRAT